MRIRHRGTFTQSEKYLHTHILGKSENLYASKTDLSFPINHIRTRAALTGGPVYGIPIIRFTKRGRAQIQAYEMQYCSSNF